jgi:hypothetical protein|nr:MAG TPA: hypothetical protein [Caudoviricetes sp.]
MKQQIIAILDKSTNNGMKADEIMELIKERAGDVAAKWMDILEDEEMTADDVLHRVIHDMTCSQQVFDYGE